MVSTVTRLSGKDWEAWANQILSLHYGATDYQRVPDKHRGDAGLEGYCPSKGHAFQSYGCEEPVSTQERYDKQRDKMTEDIGKFINNRAVLEKHLVGLKIERWALFVPYFDSSDLVAHAGKKTRQVLDAGLPYVADNFRVIICQESDFPIERDRLLNASTQGLKIEPVPATDADVVRWSESNDVLLETLKRKVCKLPTLKDDKRRAAFANDVLKWYLSGQALLEQLRDYPSLYEKVVATKSHRERYLGMAALDGSASNEILKATLESFSETLKAEAKELHKFCAEQLAYEAVADWLLRCPLDFPELVDG